MFNSNSSSDDDDDDDYDNNINNFIYFTFYSRLCSIDTTTMLYI